LTPALLVISRNEVSAILFREQLLSSIENAFNGFRLGHGYSA